MGPWPSIQNTEVQFMYLLYTFTMTWAKSFNFPLERPNQSAAKEKNSSVFLPFLSVFALDILWDRDCPVLLHSNVFQAAVQ